MKFQGSEQIAEGTFAYYFERPEGFQFVAGQFIEMSLVESSPADPFRSFSIASAPSESHVMIATRLRDSAFKQALRSMKPGLDLPIEGPYGRFTLRENDGLSKVLIAGGIGVTPFRSMIVEASRRGMRSPILLVHANRDLAGIPFAHEMGRLSDTNPEFRFVPTLTRPSESWSGETGYVDIAMLSRYVDIENAEFYVSGPPAMVQSAIEMLSIATTKDRIFSEAFEGY